MARKKKSVGKDQKLIMQLLESDISTYAELDSELANLDDGKSEASIGDVRQIRKKLFMAIKFNPGTRRLLFRFLSEK